MKKDEKRLTHWGHESEMIDSGHNPGSPITHRRWCELEMERINRNAGIFPVHIRERRNGDICLSR